jgi:DNA-binding NarL/FixJ family response regulator
VPRILLADDNSRVRHGLRELLEAEAGFQVCAEAGDGIEAVQLSESEHPDFAILDLSMPHMNGLEAARTIHERFPEIVILILTMHDPAELMDDLTAFGVRSCILKTDLDGLVEAVRGYSPSRRSDNCRAFPTHAAEDDVDHQMGVLTELEVKIVQMLAQAKGNKEIAEILSTTEKAIELHRAAVMHKLNISSTFDLVKYATRNNLIATRRWPNAS